jgi:hypothetical protein
MGRFILGKRLNRLRTLSSRPDFSVFQREFELAFRRASGEQREQLKAIGAEAFESLLQEPEPDPEICLWFGRQLEQGAVVLTDGVVALLAKHERRLAMDAERRRHLGLEPAPVIIQMKRVVQLSWFNTAGFQSSDAFEIRRSVFRSNQERRFARALLARFPGFVPLPNYPLDQIADLDRLKPLVSQEAWQYGRFCRLDAVLVTPVEGDPIAAFELDSKYHDDPQRRANDRLKDSLLSVARIQLFRLRTDDPEATSVDEWYSILTDQVLDKIDIGERLRNRDTHSVLVPVYR